nr:MAG TPA: hypothetical protein [Caudoviricetes sp.]
MPTVDFKKEINPNRLPSLIYRKQYEKYNF